MKSIGVILMGGIGEMILFTPALKALRNAFPKSLITLFLSESAPGEVVQNSGLVNEFIILRKGVIKNLCLIGDLRKKCFDLVITATGVNPVKAGLVALLMGAKFRLGENIRGRGLFYNIKVPYNEEAHQVEGNLNLVKALGVNISDKELYIHTDKKDEEFAVNFLSQYGVKSGDIIVGIHSGSGRYQARFKRWLPTRFAKLADRIVEDYNAKIVLLGGKDEIELGNRVASLMVHKPIIASGKTTLGQLAALIERTNLIVSNDSGIVHIACAVGTPVVAIFGPTNYKNSGPWGKNAVIVRKDLPCSPCYSSRGITRTTIRCKELRCFKDITVEDVMSGVRRLFG
ncbi:MAG: glycosyltransferase family 9 protein [bacterium]|nr:glycosyltransferase family 9 protein [bacterium]